MISSRAGKARTKNKKTKSGGASFRSRVLEIVRKIPKGKVLTYGQVATLAGYPRTARFVGGILQSLGPQGRIPWQRVINAAGGISTYRLGFGDEQKRLLEKEGVVFNRRGHCDLKMFQWRPRPQVLLRWGFKDLDLPALLSI